MPTHIVSGVELNSLEMSLICEECAMQEDTSTEAIKGLAQAFLVTKLAAKTWADEPVTSQMLEELIRCLGRAIKPEENKAGWRIQPVSFSNLDLATDPRNISRAMEGYCEAYVEKRFESADLAYYHFEMVHPFSDGNGRVGWLLWLLYSFIAYGVWPQSLATNFFDLRQKFMS